MNVKERTTMIDSHYEDKDKTKIDIIENRATHRLYMTAIMSWNDDVAYAMTPFKLLTLPLGVWPLQKYNTFSLVRSITCGFSLVRFQFSYYNKISYIFQ